MKLYFADTAYWRAIIDKNDRLHAKAKQVSRELQKPSKIVTSEMVLTEVLNAFSGMGPVIRAAAARFVEAIRKDANISVAPQTTEQFLEALSHYSKHEDKRWSHTDCASVLLLQRLHIKEVLTHDHHFEQAGLEILL